MALIEQKWPCPLRSRLQSLEYQRANTLAKADARYTGKPYDKRKLQGRTHREFHQVLTIESGQTATAAES